MRKYCIINLKAYEEVFDENLEEFIKILKECSTRAQELGVELVVCVNSYDLKDAVTYSEGLIQVFAQHISPIAFGSGTGHFPAVASIRLGALGSLISHSEHYLSLEDTIDTTIHAQELHLTTCICVRDNQRLEKLKSHNIVGLVALEPPELIGGNISVTSANPNIIKDAVTIIQNSQLELLVGAGIKSKEDVSKAVELGACGILVASGVIKVEDKKATILDLLEGFNLN
ncbi:MAG: triose-phosphate isomerase [Nanoarchaeota archaeon]|nr:triose-phosphate isomerase [Nanoarchaeota archaeon]